MTCITFKEAKEYSLSKSLFSCITLKGGDDLPFTIHFPKGSYKIELWGASGGFNYSPNSRPGYGGYTSGIIKLSQMQTFYFYIATQGTNATLDEKGKGGFNGGADGGYDDLNFDCHTGGSGGATDMRINSSIESRIIVAGGGGSPGCYTHGGIGGDAGGLIGKNGADNENGSAKGGIGGNQIIGADKGSGQTGFPGNEAGGSGGGGYSGGKGGGSTSSAYGAAGGGGGSSYISGYPQCTRMNIFFQATRMIQGYQPMPSIDDPLKMIERGNLGNGAVRIICLNLKPMTCISKLRLFVFQFLILTLK